MDAARKAGRKLPPAELKAVVEAAMRLAPVEAAASVASAAGNSTFEALQREWIAD